MHLWIIFYSYFNSIYSGVLDSEYIWQWHVYSMLLDCVILKKRRLRSKFRTSVSSIQESLLGRKSLKCSGYSGTELFLNFSSCLLGTHRNFQIFKPNEIFCDICVFHHSSASTATSFPIEFLFSAFGNESSSRFMFIFF